MLYEDDQFEPDQRHRKKAKGTGLGVRSKSHHHSSKGCIDCCVGAGSSRATAVDVDSMELEQDLLAPTPETPFLVQDLMQNMHDSFEDLSPISPIRGHTALSLWSGNYNPTEEY